MTADRLVKPRSIQSHPAPLLFECGSSQREHQAQARIELFEQVPGQAPDRRVKVASVHRH
jgi:hypothetical protein